MQRLTTDAVVLSAVDWGEADRLVTLFTEAAGRLTAFAAHARKSRRRFAGALLPFTCIRATLVERKGETWRLDDAQVLDAFAGLRRELATLAMAGYACELTRELCRDREAHPELYARLRSHLGALAAGAAGPEEPVRFELRALGAVGLAPRLSACARCGAEPSPADCFDPEAGGLVCGRCARRGNRPASAGTAFLRSLQSDGAPPPDGRARVEARRLLEAFVRHHLGVELRSARFMEEVGVE